MISLTFSLRGAAPVLPLGLALLAASPAAAQTPTGWTIANWQAADRDTFARLDTNHDGKLTVAEWDADPKFSAETKQKFQYGLHKVHEYDQNGDGAVTLDEMYVADKKLFDRVDANHDGIVTVEEFNARTPSAANYYGEAPAGRSIGDQASPGGYTKARKLAFAGQWFDMVDANHDGKLTAAELEANAVRQTPAVAGHDVGAMFEKLYDGNHDGVVTRAELLDWTSRNFDQMDTNHDGILTQAEIDAFYRQ